MILVQVQITSGPPFQVDDFPAGVKRSVKGAIHFRPGHASLTVDEFDFVMKTPYAKRLVELGRQGLPEPAAKADDEAEAPAVIVPPDPDSLPPSEAGGVPDEETSSEPAEEEKTEDAEASSKFGDDEETRGKRKRKKKKRKP